VPKFKQEKQIIEHNNSVSKILLVLKRDARAYVWAVSGYDAELVQVFSWLK
jgi:hypothetical protein